MRNSFPMAKIKVVKLHDDAIVPERANVDDAGLDLFSTEDVFLHAGQRFPAKTGISVEIPKGFAGLVTPKSGRAAKEGLTVLNTPGLIDTGYTGELKVILYNSEVAQQPQGYWWNGYWYPYNYSQTQPIHIQKGQKIAQLILVNIGLFEPVVVDSLEETQRGSGGLGSSGIKYQTGGIVGDTTDIRIQEGCVIYNREGY